MFIRILHEVATLISLTIFVLGIMAIAQMTERTVPDLVRIALLGP